MATGNFVLALPTLILMASHGGVTIRTRLYGEVPADRFVHEQRVVAHRAEQLSPVVRRITVVATEE